MPFSDFELDEAEPVGEEQAPIAVEDVPSDVEVAIRVLRERFSSHLRIERGVPPLLLVHQLYSLVANRTEVDQELDRLKRRNAVRVVRLMLSGTDEFAVVLTEDFEAVCR